MFGSAVVLSFYPDKVLNGTLDEALRQQLLERVQELLLPKIECRLGTVQLDLQEVGRSIEPNDSRELKGVLYCQRWRVIRLDNSGKLTTIIEAKNLPQAAQL